MTYIIGNRTPIIGDNRTPIVPGYTSGNPPEGDIAGTPGGRDYVSGRGNPYQEPQGTQATENPVMQQIETEWRAWWFECYGEEYQPGSDPVYGRVFLDHLRPLESVTNAVKIEVLNVLQNRSTVNQEVGITNFITFGNLLFRYVGEGQPVQDARARVIREIKGDPVLYTGYVSGTSEPDKDTKQSFPWAILIVGGIIILMRK